MKQSSQRWIRWSWRQSLFAFCIVLPATAVIASGNVETGLHLMMGSLLAAIVGLAPVRWARVQIIATGALFALFVMLGSFIGQAWWLAVPAMFLLGIGATWVASREKFGLVVLTFGLPVTGIGLSYPEFDASFGVATLMLTGSAVAYLIALVFPSYGSVNTPEPELLSKELAINYGVCLGLTAATAAAVGFIFNLQHIGWVAAAALFVMRPNMQFQKLRSIGRVTSVILGALAASWLLSLNLEAGLIAFVSAAALVLAAATRQSRWYLTPVFTTFLVFWLLLYGQASADNIEYRFWERTLETLVGVTIAYCYGVIIWPIMKAHHDREVKPS